MLFKQKTLLSILLLLLIIITTIPPSQSRKPHIIQFKSKNFYPTSLTWDPRSDHFILSSLLTPHLISVSDAAVISTLFSNPPSTLPQNSSFLSLSIDPRHRRLLTTVHLSSPPFSALASFSLPSFTLLFLTPLSDSLSLFPSLPSSLSVDFNGNAYVTDAQNDVIFKVDESGNPSILTRIRYGSARNEAYRNGLNGVVYNSKGYLLVTNSETGKLYKVNVDNGNVRRVILNRKFSSGIEGIAMRRDGVVLVVSGSKLYFLKSDDSWSEGVVFDETKLDEEREACAVTVGADNRVYVLYGHVKEGRGIGNGGEGGREVFGIAEIESEKESAEEGVWIFVLLGAGLAYFLFWRFQMRQLFTNMNKKTS